MIITYSEYLARELRNSLSERAEQALKYIMEGGQRMQGLIEGLLAYSRALHEVEDPLAVVDPGQVLDKVLLNLRAMILDKSAFVTSSELPSVMVHEIHLVQLFQNLIGNSLKYSRSDVVPEIAVRGARVEELVRFTVEDNGIGIPRQYASDIFGIFKRLHSKDYSGSGIGLAICQRIVARYGGSIWVDSEPGRGATFHFTLPAGEEL